MPVTKDIAGKGAIIPATFGGLFWLGIAVLGAALFFYDGLAQLFGAWQMPEYSHGPLIPVLSGFLLLRHLKTVPVQTGPVTDRGPGLALLIFALALGAAGRLINVGDIVAYALILWVSAILLISFGWRTGRQFWPSVLHLVYMLPLPGALYYGVSTYLQGVSSELGVYFLDLLQIPVFLEGNIIDLGVYKLHVAEACSGLRYLFPILSFSYIFAVLYRGPMWHKALLLISAAPITIFMNSVRIALAGVVVNNYGLEYVDGFTHFFEGEWDDGSVETDFAGSAFDDLDFCGSYGGRSFGSVDGRPDPRYCRDATRSFCHIPYPFGGLGCRSKSGA